MQNRSTALWILVFFLGWLQDFLFWDKAPGVSFAIDVALLAAGGLLALYWQGQRLSGRSALLLLPILFFAIFSFVRLEPMSRLLACALALALLALLAVTATGGRWPLYSLADYLLKSLELMASAVARGAEFIGETRAPKQPASAATGDAAAPGAGAAAFPAARRDDLAPVLRGVLLALPVLAIFLALLASADMIFAQRLRDITDLFDLGRIPEYFLRMILIGMAAYFLIGVYLHAARKSGDEKLVGEDRPASAGFLGFTEAAIVLGSVTALFAVFVMFQFQYFFRGQANINLEGFTYSEYARRGFGELVFVAVISLLLLQALNAVTRRASENQRRTFSGLSIGLTVLVGVMLVSAFQRLLLYEDAYGFSRLRTYPHVFMVWLGLLLAATALLEAARRPRGFATAALLAAVGFAATLNLMNVDAFIARQNVLRAAHGEELDVPYLVSLSDDAVPELVALYHSAGLPAETREAAGAALACRLRAQQDEAERIAKSGTEIQPQPWQSFHLSEWQGERWLAAVAGELQAYRMQHPTGQYQWAWQAKSPAGEVYPCMGVYEILD